MTFRRALTFYDVTNITVGAIVGADIYIASAITAGLLGPASLLAWLLAGVLATILALTLAECAHMVPEVGGPFAYTTRAFGRFPGFLAGWSMWIAELTALPVFAIAFTNYLGEFVALGDAGVHTTRIAFLTVLTTINVISVRFAGRVNDALTALKLAPLVALVIGGIAYIAGHPEVAHANLTPFAPYGFDRFATALVLIFWAFVGFELATVPSGEVEDPRRTIPRALATGMAIVTAFYLCTNTVVYALVPHEQLANSPTPLVAAATVVFGSAGAAIMAIGAMISVSGSDESDMLGSSRLGYAMAADGLLPRALASVHSRFRTPHVALIAQGVLATALTFVDQIPRLIAFAVFNLAFSFLLSALALARLHRQSPVALRRRQRALPLIAITCSIALLLATSVAAKIAGTGVLAVGAVVYLLAAPRTGLPEAQAHASDPARIMRRLDRRQRRFLGALLAWLRPPPRR